MAIKRQSRFDINEICEEFGIERRDLIFLIESGSLSPNEPKYKQSSPSLTTVLEMFLTGLEGNKISRINSEITVRYYSDFIKRFIKYSNEKQLFFNDLNEEIILDFITSSSQKELNDLSRGTINTYFSIIKSIATYAYENEIVNKDISYKFKKRSYYTLPKYFSEKQIRDIFRLTMKRNYCYLWKAIFITLLGTGLRISELANLRVNDFDIEEDLIYTIGKGKKPRVVPMYPQVKKAVLEYLTIYDVKWSKNNDEYLFCKDFGKNRKRNIKADSIRYTLNCITEQLRLPKHLTVHSFRHTFAVNSLKVNMEIEYLCQVLGHENISTTQIYTKLLPNDLRDELQKKYPIPFEKLMQEILGV